MIAVLISGGSINGAFATEFIEKCNADWIIAVDKGLLFCQRYGIKPHYVVGDFDSLDREVLEPYEQDPDVQVKYLRPEKDDSDSESAMHLAMELGAESIYFLGATGTRLDHVMANIQLLSYTCIRGIPMYLVDEHNLIVVLNQTTTLKKASQFGDYVSFFSLGDQVTDLTLTGFKYPLVNYRLTNTSCGLTLSNEILDEEATIAFTDGLLLMVQSRD